MPKTKKPPVNPFPPGFTLPNLERLFGLLKQMPMDNAPGPMKKRKAAAPRPPSKRSGK